MRAKGSLLALVWLTLDCLIGEVLSQTTTNTTQNFQQTTVVNLRLVRDEVYYIDLVQYSTMIRQVKVVQPKYILDPSATEKEKEEKQQKLIRVNETALSSWYHQDYFVYSVDSNSCIEKGTLSEYLNARPLILRAYFEDEMYIKFYPYNLTTQQVLSRRLKFAVGKLYVTTAYFQVFDNFSQPNNYINLMETKVLDYSPTELKQDNIKDAVGVNRTNFWRSRPDRITQAGVPEIYSIPNITCFIGYYITTYEETVFVCSSITHRNETDMYIYRTVQKRYFYFATLGPSYNMSFVFEQPLTGDVSVLIEPTPDKSFELIMFFFNRTDIFMVNFNRDEVFNIQAYKLSYKLCDVSFVKKTLMIFYSDIANEQRSYYLERNPGSRFMPDNITLFADAKYLSSLYSNENVEIILEMYKQFHAEIKLNDKEELKGFAPPITHLLYSYDLISKKLVQISTQIFTSHLDEKFYGRTFRVDSFSNLDMIILMNHIQLLSVETNRGINRTSIQLNMDAFSGFGSTSGNNNSYAIHPTVTSYDPWTGNYFVFPFDGNFLNVSTMSKKCDILRQKIKRPFIKIEYNQTKQENNFTLDLIDTKIGTTVYTFNFTFFNDIDTAMQKKPGDNTLISTIWKGSSLTEFQVNPNFEQRFIDLDLLVKGNYIMRVNSDLEISKKPHFPYFSASLDETNKVMESSLFLIENFRIINQNDLYLQDIKSILAFGITEPGGITDRVIFIRTKKETGLTMYTIPKKGKELLPIKGPVLTSDIVKVIPVKENLYIFFDSDGSLSLFYAKELRIVPLSMPGVGCLDIELLTHNRLKPALLCYNNNFQFTIYYIDQLIAGSLSNSYQNVALKKTSSTAYSSPFDRLNKDSKIYISEFYPGKVFMYQPDSKEKTPNFLVFYLDVEEFPLIHFLNDITLINNKSEETGITSKIQSMEFVEDRLVVHYRAAEDNNYISVYKIDELWNTQLTKLIHLPVKYKIKEESRLMYFHKHFQSSIYANKNKPFLLLPVMAETGGLNYNVMVIDPFAPTLETLPTFLLPKHSTLCDACQSILFEYFVASVDRIRYYSAGILHYSRNPHNLFRDETKDYYMFQLISADSPKVFFSLGRESVVSYKNLFQKYKSSSNLLSNFTFQSDLVLNDTVFSQITISQKIVNNASNSSQNVSTHDFDVQLEEVHSDVVGGIRDAKIVMYATNFTEIPKIKNFSVFSWKLEAESFFDNTVGTFEFLPPLKKVGSKTGHDISSIINIDTFCRAYKLEKQKLKCIKKGWIFFHQEDIEIFYKDNLADIQPGDSIRFPFNVNECTESVVANHTLIAVCTYSNERHQIITNLLDLSQKYIQIAGLNIFAKFSTPRIVKTYDKSFLQFSKTIMDERNIKGVANNYNFMYEIGLAPRSSDWSTHVGSNLTYINGVDSKLTDSAIGVGRIKKYNRTDETNGFKIVPDVYKMSGININTGNLVYVQIFEESFYVGPITVAAADNKTMTSFDRHPTSKYKIAVLKIKASTDVRRVVLNRASVINVVFNPLDAVAEENNGNYTRYSLVHFPSYHSYLYRYKNNTNLTNTTFLKLENPFAEIEDKHWDNKPVCYKWACLLINTFDGDQNFVKIYDMRYDELSYPEIPPNCRDIYFDRCGYSQKANAQVVTSESDSFDLDDIPDNYTIRPIQVLNTTKLQLIRFDEETSNDNNLVVMMFFTDNSIKVYNLSRKARLTSNNLYFMSKYIEVKVQTSYNVELKYTYSIKKWTEGDFYKYFIQIGIISAFGIAMVIFYYKYLKAEQLRIEKIDKEDAVQEMETRKSILSEVTKLVFQQEGASIELKQSLMKRVSNFQGRKTIAADFRKSFATEMIQWKDNNDGSDEEGKDKDGFYE
jgi:hypothetical protein